MAIIEEKWVKGKNVMPLAVSTKIQHTVTSIHTPSAKQTSWPRQQEQYILCTDESTAQLQKKGYLEFYEEME